MEISVSFNVNILICKVVLSLKKNAANTQMYIKSSLETYTRDKEEYYRVRKVNTKIVIGDAWIKLVAKNPSLQFAGIYFLSSLLVLILFYSLFFISSFVFWFFFLLLSFSNLVFLSLNCFLLVFHLFMFSFSLFF